MSVIQNIRDKYARFAVIAIALAMVGFILIDYWRDKSRRGGFGSRSNNVGSVNGHTISDDEFSKTVDQFVSGYTRQGYPESPMLRQQAVQQAWDQEINVQLLNGEINKLGMRIGSKERGDIMFGPDAPQDIKSAGTDDNGNYDPVRAKQQIDRMMKSSKVSKEQKQQFNDYVDQLEQQRKIQKYFAFFTNSTNVPRWYVEKQTADNSLMAKISVVKILYTDSSFLKDSSANVTDAEIADYINKHKDRFKQEETRSINFVSFSGIPTAADSAQIKSQGLALKAEFDSTKDVANFLARNGSTESFEDYKSPIQLPPVSKDSIIKLPKNGVYGPYIDGGDYVLAKLVDEKQMPDSVKARHILVQTADPQKQVQILDDSTAKKRIDSIEAAIKGGASFDSLVKKYSDDKGSAAKGGDLGYFTSGRMVKEFNDFCFNGKTGDKKVVKTAFGYHYIEITDQKDIGPHYQVAMLNQRIEPSSQTTDSTSNAANSFAADCRDQKTFDDIYTKTLKPKGMTKGIAANIHRLDGTVQGINGFSRSFVREIYNAKVGEVLKPEPIGDEFVVAILTEALDEGTLTPLRARAAVEPVLHNKKILAKIKQQIGKVTTLEAAATSLHKNIETFDSLRMKSGAPHSTFASEPKVNGAALNPANKGKVVPEAIEGQNGVFVVKVEDVTATSAGTGSTEEQRKQMYEQAKNAAYNPIDALKKTAAIKDKRADKW